MSVSDKKIKAKKVLLSHLNGWFRLLIIINVLMLIFSYFWNSKHAYDLTYGSPEHISILRAISYHSCEHITHTPPEQLRSSHKEISEECASLYLRRMLEDTTPYTEDIYYEQVKRMYHNEIRRNVIVSFVLVVFINILLSIGIGTTRWIWAGFSKSH